MAESRSEREAGCGEKRTSEAENLDTRDIGGIVSRERCVNCESRSINDESAEALGKSYALEACADLSD
jgi:hypothetical protein